MEFTMKNSRILCKPEKRDFAKKMRANQTFAERILWEELRCKKLGVGFRRQVIITGWIVDFFCSEIKLVIEVDGDSHKENSEADSYRDYRMGGLNMTIIRVKNEDVINNLDVVLNKIKNTIISIKNS